MSTPISPILPAQRIATLDYLRGFALLGILMVNMLWMNAPVGISLTDYPWWDSPADRFSEFLIYFLFEGKFYPIFSFLFGYGFWLFIHKADQGKSLVGLYAWRLVVLILFGAAHIVLLWPGDILFFYGLLGLLLLPFRNKSNRKLLVWTGCLILLPLLIMAIAAWGFSLALNQPEMAPTIQAAIEEQQGVFVALIEKALRVYPSGSFSEIVNIRLEEYSTLLTGAVLMFYPNVLAFLLLGFYAARKGLLQQTKVHLPFFRKMAVWGLAIGLLAGLGNAWLKMNSDLGMPTLESVAAMSLNALGGPLLSLAYISLLMLLFRNGRWALLQNGLAAAGRMALTCYLMHSILSALLFHSYGLGLYGQVAIWQGVVLSLLIFALQLPFSVWWLRIFHYGPFEWLWRSLTYRRLQPFRKHS